jgi:hypothetical protein
MKKDREFENILDECLDNMLRGKSIEQCLADYPDHAAALEPMLRTAFRAKMATNIRPRPEFKDRARHQFQAAIREMDVKPVPTRRGFFPSLKPAWIALAALVAIVIAGGGTVYAAGNALPDSPLYPIKMATEQVRLFLTPSDIGKAELYAEFADKRVEEIIKMADKGEVELVHKATDRLNEQLVAMASLTIGDNGIPTDGHMFSLGAAESSGNGEEAVTATMAPPAATIAPTTAPTPAPVLVTPGPAKTAPQETAESTPALDAALSAASDRQADDKYSEENGDRERREKLKDLLLRQAIENPEALEKALETAPESLRDIILWAIEVANAGYAQNISNLE